MNKFNFKALNRKDIDNIARIRAYMWLGLNDEIDKIFVGMKNIGYGLSDKYINKIDLPNKIFFNGIFQSILK